MCLESHATNKHSLQRVNSLRFRALGNSGLKVSVIGIGAAQFASKVWGYGTRFSDSQVLQIISKGLDCGINLIDTAEAYGDGLSETLIGKAIKERRDDVVVTTKVSPWNLRYRNVLKAADRSLKRLEIDSIDLYQIHFPNPLVPLSETLNAMERLVKEGKVRYIGVSNFNVGQLRKVQECLRNTEVVSNEIEYNLLSRKAETDVIPYCNKEGITVIAYSPLAGGIITGAYGPHHRPRDRARAFNFWSYPRQLKKAERLFRVLEDIATDHGVSVPQVALGRIITTPSCVAIPAALSYQEVQENAEATNLVLNGSDLLRIDDAAVSLDWFLEVILFIIRRISWTQAAMRSSLKEFNGHTLKF